MPAGSPGWAAHFDAQFIASSIGVQGTLGTTDTAGTALTLPFAVDPITGAAWGKEIGTPSVIVAGGTLATGTVSVTAGTLSPIPTIGQLTFGTLGTTGATLTGTLVGGTGSGAGTEIFVTSISLSIPSNGGSQDVSIGWGTSSGTFHSGTSSLVRGFFPAGGGIAKSFNPPINSGTNAQLAYFQAGAGTVDINVTYFITASTL